MVSNMLELDTMDSKGKLRLNVVTKPVGGGQIELRHVGSSRIEQPEPRPVNLDTMDNPSPSKAGRKLDALDALTAAVHHVTAYVDAALSQSSPVVEACTHHAEALREQAAALIQQAARLEQASADRATGADGRTRPAWNRWDNNLTEQRVRELRQAGQSVRDIANALGCSRGTAHRIIKKLGV